MEHSVPLDARALDLKALAEVASRTHGPTLDTPEGRAEIARLWVSVQQVFLDVAAPLVLPAMPAAVTAFEHEGHEICVVACTDGQVLVGGTSEDGFSAFQTLEIGDFQKRSDEVLGILWTRRALSLRTDVLVVIRRWPPGGRPPTLRLHRASVRALDDGRIEAVPRNDEASGNARGWPAVDLPDCRLPPWMRITGMVGSPGADLVSHPPPDWTSLADAARPRHGNPTCAAYNGRQVVFGTDQEYLILGTETGVEGQSDLFDPSAFSAQRLPSRPRSLALGRFNGVECVLVGCQDRQIAVFRLGSSFQKRDWPIRPLDLVRGLCVSGRRSVPDLLIATQRRELRRIREVPRSDLKALWDRMVSGVSQTYGLQSLEDWVTWTGTQFQHRPDREGLRGLLCLVLDRLEALAPPRAREAKAVGRLLCRGELVPIWAWLSAELQRFDTGMKADPDHLVVSAVASLAGPGFLDTLDVMRGGYPGPETKPLDRQAVLEQAVRPGPVDAATQAVRIECALGEWQLEDVRNVAPAPAGGLALASGSGGQVLSVLARTDLYRFRGQGGRLTAGAPERLSLPGEPVLHHVRAFGPWTVAGGQGGKAAVIGLDGRIEDWQGPAGAYCRASAWLDGSPGGPFRLALAWIEGRRSFLEVVRARPADSGLALDRERIASLPIPCADALDALPEPSRTLLAVGDGEIDEVALLELDGDGVREVGQFSVDAGVTALRFDRVGNEARILAATRGGMLWCVRVRDLEVLWTYKARWAIRALDIRPGPDLSPARYAVAAEPGNLLVLDESGRRMWQRRFESRVSAIQFLGSPDKAPRVVFTTWDGAVGVFHGPDPSVDWRLLATTVDRKSSSRQPRDLHAVLSVENASQYPSLLPSLVDRRARAYAVTRAVANRAGDRADQVALARVATFRELAHMCAALPAGASGWESVLFEAVVRDLTPGQTDASRQIAAVAVAEALRRFGREPTDLVRLMDRLDRIPLACRKDPWVRTEAARLFLRAVQDDRPGAMLDPVLACIDELDLDLAGGFRCILRPGEAAMFANELVRLAEESASSPLRLDPDRLAVIAELGSRVPQENHLAAALGRACSLARRANPDPHDRWQDLAALFALARTVPDRRGAGSFANLVTRLGRLGPPELPADDWPLKRQIEWFRSALASPLDMGEPAAEGITCWARVARLLARALNEVVRETLAHRLLAVEGTTRFTLRLEEATRPAPNRVVLGLVLVPEGQRPLHDIVAEVTPADPAAFRPTEGDGRTRFRRQRLAEGEPDEHIRLSGYCSPVCTNLAFRVKVDAKGRPAHEAIWCVGVPRGIVESSTTATTLSPFPDGLPNVFRRTVDSLAKRRTGVILVAADDVPTTTALVSALAVEPGTRVIDLDAVLRDLGPGRRYHRDLTARTLFRALLGRDLQGEGPDEPGNQHARIVLFPCAELAERLQEPVLSSVWDVTVDRLLAHVRKKQPPAFVFPLRTALLARFRRRMGPEIPVVNPYLLDVWMSPSSAGRPPDEVEAVRWLQKAARLRDQDALRLVQEADGDLRILLQSVARTTDRHELGQDERLHFAREDVRGLDIHALLALFVLADTETTLPVKELRAGHIAADSFRSTTTTSGNPKEVARPGGVLTRGSVSRIQSDASRPVMFRVRGWAAGRPVQTRTETAHLLDLVEGIEPVATLLVDLGIARRIGEVVLVRPLFESLVEQALAGNTTIEAAFERLAGERLLDGVDLRRLADPSRELVRLLAKGPVEPATERIRWTGRIWAQQGENMPSWAESARVVSAFTGRQPGPKPGSAGRLSGLLELFPPPTSQIVGVGVCDANGICDDYILVTLNERQPDYRVVLGALVFARNRSAVSELRDTRARPHLIVLGPGVETWADPDRGDGLALLKGRDFRRILGAEDPIRTFWTAVRAQAGLSIVSPFQAEGALPPESPMFAGRRAILEEVRLHLPNRNYLLLGSRQIGKTSLLHRIHFEAQHRSPQDVEVFDLDAQGRTRAKDLLAQVHQFPGADSAADTAEGLAQVARRVRSRGRTAIFCINEIDGLLKEDRKLFERMRGMSDDGLARFIMVGYATVLKELDNPTAPLYHMCSGPGGERVFNLAELDRGEALTLVDKLEEPPLDLAWDTERQREEGRDLLVERGYRIPWIIQSFCRQLVGHLDETRRSTIRLDDVRRVVDGESSLSLLEHLDNTRFDGVLNRDDPVVNKAGRVVLAALVRDRYFPDPSHFEFERLPREDPEHRSFSAGDAARIVREAIGRNCSPREQQTLIRYFDRFPFDAFLRGLCLTLILKPARSRRTSERAWCFQNHIYPIEVHRAVQIGRTTPADRLIDALSDLLKALD